MSKKTLALIISLVVLTAVLLFIALSTKEQKTVTTTPTTQVTPTPAAQSVLTMSPATIDLSTGPTTGTKTVNVEIATSENQVTAVQLEMAYDPRIVKNLAIKPGTFFDSPTILLDSNDATTGRVSYALGIAPAQDPKSGNGTVATLTFTVTPVAGVQQTTLTLLPKSLVTARGVGASVLKSATGTTIVLPASAVGTTVSPTVPVTVVPTTAPTTPAQ